MQKTGENFAELCRTHGWKCTPQRLAVYRYIRTRRNHPTVDQVLAEVRVSIPAVTRESVYRILNEFAHAGIIRRLDHFSSARYDTCTGSHLHFICEVCGKITDFPLTGAIEIPPELSGQEVHHTEVRISGVCQTCRTAGKHPVQSGSNNPKKGS